MTYTSRTIGFDDQSIHLRLRQLYCIESPTISYTTNGETSINERQATSFLNELTTLARMALPAANY
jgi:hypothetical protein